MTIFLAILIGIATILVLITIHEFAHFMIAKLSGAYVYEFSVGIGPKILQWGKKETRYTIRLLPLGGYVSIASEIADAPKGREEEVVPDERLIENIHRGKKALFIAGGSLMNLFLAFLLLIIGYGILPYKQDLNLPPTFANYGPLSDAIKVYNNDKGHIPILTNDKITKIYNPDDASKGTNITNYSQLVTWLQNNTKRANESEKSLELKVIFNQTETKIVSVTLDLTKVAVNKVPFLGVTAGSYHLSAGQVIGDGIVDSFKNSYGVLLAFGKLLTFNWAGLSGPVGIVKSTDVFLNSHNTSQQAASSYFRWAAFLSANLFLFNMLPLPPLDGYKFVENGYEAIFRRKVNTKFKIIVTVIGALCLLALIIGITIKDIWF